MKLFAGAMIAATVLASAAGTAATVQAAQSGWVYNFAQKAYNYYGADGKKYTDWHYMTRKEGEKKDHWNYFGSDGRLYTGWQWMDAGEGEKTPHWSYFGANGWLRTGWVQLGKGTAEPDGNSARHWSYFGGNGWLRTGWVQLGKGTAEPDGNTNRHWSYFGGNGWLRTGLQNMGQGTSNPDGNAVAHKSYFGDNGWLVTNKTFAYSGISYKADDRGWLSEVKQVTDKSNNSKNTNTLKYTVTFTDGNGKTLSTQTVEEGKSATPPAEPARTGYTFKGWDKSYSNINGNLTINAKWEVHEHKWQAVYKTVHHEAVTHKEEKRTPTKSWWQQTNAIQIYGNLGSVSPAFYQVIMDDLTAVGMDYDDLYGIRDNVPAFRLLDELQADLYDYLNAFWQLYTVDDALYTKCLGYMYNEEETLDYLYSYSGKITELSKSIKRKIKQLQNIELGELTETGKLACETIYNKIDKITAQYKKLYNNGFPDPDGDGKRGHASADRNDHNQHTLYFNDYDFGQYVGYILHQNAWRQATIDRPGWYNAVLVEDITVVDKEAWDEKVLDYYKCSCGQKKK